MGTDACVPISELAACLEETEADVATTGLVAPLVGHVGDGNFHLGIMFDPADPDEVRRAEGLAWRTGERAIRFGGTCTGEHGIGGLHKMELLEQEHGDGVQLMRAIKHALDPHGLMNPGKMLLGCSPAIAELADINARGTAVLLVEQNARMALAASHRAYVLASGRIVASGPAATLAETSGCGMPILAWRPEAGGSRGPGRYRWPGGSPLWTGPRPRRAAPARPGR